MAGGVCEGQGGLNPFPLDMFSYGEYRQRIMLKKLTFLICLALASMLRPAQGQENDTPEKQFSEWHAKAEKGDAESQFTVGYFYIVGQGVGKNEAEGVKWYRKAAEQNLATAQFNLATCYETGQGVTTDLAEAARWYRKAADQNLAAAQFNLGQAYLHGAGVASNLVEAVKWYRKGAEQNNASAQYALGRCYLRSLGVVADPLEGYKWCFLAASQGDIVAKNTVAKLNSMMAPEEIAQGKQRANAWLARHPKPKSP